MKKPPRINCKTCKTTYELNFECVDCCIRWLLPMDRETLAINAPVIKAATSEAHYNAVRIAYKAAAQR